MRYVAIAAFAGIYFGGLLIVTAMMRDIPAVFVVPLIGYMFILGCREMVHSIRTPRSYVLSTE